MSDIEYSVIKSDVIKSFDCISNTSAYGEDFLRKYKILRSIRRMTTYTNVHSVFVTCLKLISNVFSVHKRTCLISHTSAYVGANEP